MPKHGNNLEYQLSHWIGHIPNVLDFAHLVIIYGHVFSNIMGDDILEHLT